VTTSRASIIYISMSLHADPISILQENICSTKQDSGVV
jgi:hypothetical protein